MNTRLIFLCLSSLISKGVFGDEVMSVSVMKGDSLTLHTDVIKQNDDLIVWSYGPDRFVARINGKAGSLMFSDDEIFRNRLELDDQTGDLTIRDVTSEHTGEYQLKISRNRKVSYRKYIVTVSGEVKSVVVREGHSVILYTHVLKRRDDMMEWRFGPERTIVAKIIEATFTPSDDERFRGIVKRDDSTGALMINVTRTHHSGTYRIKISGNNKISYKKFNVTISDELSLSDGHSVTLYTHGLKPSDDAMDTDVAEINGKAYTGLSDNERFRVKRDSGLYPLRSAATFHDSHVLWLIPAALLICVCVWVFVHKGRGSMKTSHALTDDKSKPNV